MESNWLAASSFERTCKLLSAVNTLSVHAKLLLAGSEDPTDRAELLRSRDQLTDFLNGFERLLAEAQQSEDGAILGTDPRLADLAQRYLAGKRAWPQPSVLFQLPLSEVARLVRSESLDDLHTLVDCLSGLRLLLEEHSLADSVGILGEM